jgi:flagellar export protein FliJ
VTGPSFRFRLERVRALRERREDLARQALAQALTQRSDSRAHLDTVDAHLEQARAEQRRAIGPTATATAAELQARQAFVEHVETQRLAGLRELEHRDTVVAERDLELGSAAREHEMLERLKERQHTEHRRELARQEGGLLDEVALDRFRRSAA